MYDNKIILLFLATILINNTASAMKRSFEDDKSKKTKKMKVDLSENKKNHDIPQRHEGIFYCQIKTLDCTYCTNRLDKIEEHHRLHNDPNAVPCDKACDFLGANERVVKNHQTKWHKPADFDNQKQLEPTVKKLKCGYCGIKGNDLTGHKRRYHGKSFGRMKYNQNFSIKKNIPSDVE